MDFSFIKVLDRIMNRACELDGGNRDYELAGGNRACELAGGK